LFNAPPGDWEGGERGMACLPGREEEFRRGFAQALEYAQILDCPRLHVVAGKVPAGSDRASLRPIYESNLAWAAKQAASVNREVLIEPINLRDIPGFYLNRQEQAHAIVESVGAPNLKVQMDLYHCQISEGDLAMKLRQYIPTGRVGHLQIAGVPERLEPDVGEVNYAYLFSLLDELGYTGHVGLEYRPKRGATPGGTSDGLGWFKNLS
jgi:hydroxypyruvate isomerase